MILALYLLTLFDANKKFLNSCGYQTGVTVIQMINCSLHIAWCYLFVGIFKLEIAGLAYASTVTNLSNLILVTIYSSNIESLKEAWTLPDASTFYGIWDYLKIGIPSLLMAGMGMWCYEIIAMMSIYITVEAVAAHTICYNFFVLIYMIVCGL